jgi:hypothetical protein
MNHYRRKLLALVAISILAAATTRPTQVAAEGAVAVGIAPSGPSTGYSFGVRVNEPTTEAARAGSLTGCKGAPMSSGTALASGAVQARAQCAVVATFHNKCVTLAFDPNDGTPGAGWAVADSLKAADDEALRRCRSTAGSARREFCKVAVQKCDGTAK